MAGNSAGKKAGEKHLPAKILRYWNADVVAGAVSHCQCGTYHGHIHRETITDFDFNETGEIGVLFREDGWTYRGHIGGLAYDYIAPRKYLEVQYVAGYILPKDATEDHPATLPADLEAIVWYMIAQQWAIIENDAAGLSAFSISDVSWTFDKNISETWQSVISKYQRW